MTDLLGFILPQGRPKLSEGPAIPFMSTIGPSADQIQLLIKALLNGDPLRRLGCVPEGTKTKRVMKHHWYSGFNWKGLLNREVDGDIPFKPKVPKNMESIGEPDRGGDEAKSSNWNPVLGVDALSSLQLRTELTLDDLNIHKLNCSTLEKDNICKKKQEEHVLNEFSIMKMLTEMQHVSRSANAISRPSQLTCGNLMYHLKKNRKFSEDTTRFYAATVVSVYEQLHSLVIAYRSLMPENIVLSEKGYGVMVDFGLAKKLDDGQTYTFCGTPDYLAPEIIRGTGHDWGVDYWCLGIFLYELANGSAPFSASNQLSRTRKILKGVEYINMPTHFSSGLIDLVTSLLDNDQSKRLGMKANGVQDIKNHRWFAGFNWDGLLNQTISAPITPDLPEDLTELGKKAITSADPIPDSDWHPDLKRASAL
ncbi:hypothetical protein THAOC_29583 [Thalassiosira oceanica]|uniref:Protein kinase domain-containing protein n=1 Tax=Thalassiosira oceanica TaxID=159749 RepID=K0RQY3_THAOC|nr:hypothetical protein THAOC_29583 [Thalassiosira oceanica]|eukprot:EJK51261.1 hypothetical protein THAOC_29583 [Thalassiosira oceanica]